MTGDATVNPSAIVVGGERGDVEAVTWPVASLLSLWDALWLELGDMAVVTDGHPWSALAATVARWHGALPVLFITQAGTAPAGAELLRVDDPNDAVQSLAARLKVRPGVAAAELSGRADIVDLILEAVPSQARVALAGNAGELLTIDYYVNVHRKGLHLVSRTLTPAAERSGAPDAPVTAAHLARARALLSNADRLAQAADALSAGGAADPRNHA